MDIFEIVHKSGEPNGSTNLVSKSVVSLDNLFRACLDRFIFKFNFYDGKFPVKYINKPIFVIILLNMNKFLI